MVNIVDYLQLQSADSCRLLSLPIIGKISAVYTAVISIVLPLGTEQQPSRAMLGHQIICYLVFHCTLALYCNSFVDQVTRLFDSPPSLSHPFSVTSVHCPKHRLTHLREDLHLDDFLLLLLLVLMVRMVEVVLLLMMLRVLFRILWHSVAEIHPRLWNKSENWGNYG